MEQTFMRIEAKAAMSHGMERGLWKDCGAPPRVQWAANYLFAGHTVFGHDVGDEATVAAVRHGSGPPPSAQIEVATADDSGELRGLW
uniref:Uncharacterized protein n=1 Tax=Arundo donax TaxID=35708 RepID=A0A0A9AVP9_ARUDO